MTGKTVLSDRLHAVVSMVSKGSVVCDVGSDHGFVPIYLVEQRICSRAIAADVNKGPLIMAKTHIRERGLSDYIETRLSDGLEAISPGEAQTLICAGMGGRLMIRILSLYREKTDAFHELILQPQSEIFRVRQFLRQRNYEIIQEDMVLEEGKFYPVMKAITLAGRLAGMGGMEKDGPGNRDGLPEEWTDRYGRLLLEGRHPVLCQLLRQEKNTIEGVLQDIDAGGKGGGSLEERRRELLERLKDVREILRQVYG